MGPVHQVYDVIMVMVPLARANERNSKHSYLDKLTVKILLFNFTDGSSRLIGLVRAREKHEPQERTTRNQVLHAKPSLHM